MNSKFGMFSVLVFGVIMLLIPASSLANAQEYGQYYENKSYEYNDDKKNNEPVIIVKNEPIYKKEKKEKKEPPILFVKKELLFCDSIASKNDDETSCDRPNSDLFLGPDSGRYIKGCSSEECEGINPSIFDIKITDDIKFSGSEKGTIVNLNGGGERFTVIEKKSKTESSSPQENINNICQFSGFDGGIIGLFDINEEREFTSCILFEGDCSGLVQDKEQKECIVKNYVVNIQDLTSTITVAKNWFVCDNEDDNIDCTVEPQQEGDQISFETSDSGNYIQCNFQDNNCPFVEGAGFDIVVNGNNPEPDTFSALINTLQDVELGTGAYEISELLSSDQIVENALINIDNVIVGDVGSFTPSTFPLVFDPNGQRVFIVNVFSNSVSIIDLNNLNTVTNVDLFASGGIFPFSIAFDHDGQRVFTSNIGNNSVSIVELDNFNTVTNVDLAASGGNSPYVLVFDPDGQRLFTANSVSNSVSIIEFDNFNTVTNVNLSSSTGNGPLAIAFDPDGQRIFTANTIRDSVSIIELDNFNTVTNVNLSPSGGDGPSAIAFDPDNQRIFTANADSDSVSIIELDNFNTVTNVDLTSSCCLVPLSIAFDPDGQRIFTANTIRESVSIIELEDSNNVTEIDLFNSGGIDPFAIVFDPDLQRIFTANEGSNSISIIELDNFNTVTNVDLSPSDEVGPFAILFDPDGQRIFTANHDNDSVSIIDLPSASKLCQDSGFDTGDIRTFESSQDTLQQITCVNFSEQCTGEIVIQDTETQKCIIDNYTVLVNMIN